MDAQKHAGLEAYPACDGKSAQYLPVDGLQQSAYRGSSRDIHDYEKYKQSCYHIQVAPTQNQSLAIKMQKIPLSASLGPKHLGSNADCY